MKADEGSTPRLRHDAAAPAAASGAHVSWVAELQLELVHERGGTRLRAPVQRGPLRVQRPFRPEGDGGPCHVYVLHPPGGVVGGDELALDVRVGHRAEALLTTPGATKLYRAVAPDARAGVRQRFVGDGAALIEWLPHETIAYDGAVAQLRTEVELSAEATYAGWELFCLGRPAAGERFTRGELVTELVLRRAGRLAYLERGRFRGGDALLHAPWGLSGQPVLATFVVAAPCADASWVDAVRDEVGAEDGLFAITLVSGVVVARFLGGSAREARALFERAHRVLRPHYAGRAAVHPRIWST